MNKKCYGKEVGYIIPKVRCHFCKRHIKPGDGVYIIIITWGEGRSACKECYDSFEIDWSLHRIEDPEEDDDEIDY